jgi:uncharacterized protein
MTDLVTTVLDHVRAGRFDAVREMFAPNLRSLVPSDGLAAAWNAAIGGLGAVTDIGSPHSEDGPSGSTVVRVPLTFERGALDLVIGVAGEWLVGLNLTPPTTTTATESWTPPPYADPAAFDEVDVSIDAMGLPVPGTLTLPHGHARVPAVLLLAGSGPNDRDETVGANKPFRDLAWGLASRGIAVLRADKVTLTHGRSLPPTLTLAEEYLPHAQAALALLRKRTEIDAQHLVVAGHSLGGTVAPRVAAADGAVAGLIMLAAGAQPMHHAAVRQFRYLAGLGTADAAGLAATADAMAVLADHVDDPGLTVDTPPSELPWGVPASYWLDVRDYDPVAAAASLTVPMLFIQGGRDYQVTVADDLALWRAGLPGREDVIFSVFEPGNHLLAAGTGPSSPTEYQTLQHVDVSIMDEIAGWTSRLP